LFLFLSGHARAISPEIMSPAIGVSGDKGVDGVNETDDVTGGV
jgi:hypothetical protein